MWNPYNYTVVGQTGTSDFVCVDAQTGKLVWQCGPSEIGSPGAYIVFFSLADGRLYGVGTTMSNHIGVGTSRPYSLYDYNKIINYQWYPPSLYCFGKGPTQFNNIAVSKDDIKYGEAVTITGSLADTSPSIASMSILSNYSRPTGSPAPSVPVDLSFISSNGTAVPFATLSTDNKGKFSYTWYPWETGPLSIVVQSEGSSSYEAPDTAYTAVTVNSVTPNLAPLLEGTVAIFMVLVVIVTVMVYMRRPRPQEESKP
jgi:hypothetical protein